MSHLFTWIIGCIFGVAGVAFVMAIDESVKRNSCEKLHDVYACELHQEFVPVVAPK